MHSHPFVHNSRLLFIWLVCFPSFPFIFQLKIIIFNWIQLGKSFLIMPFGHEMIGLTDYPSALKDAWQMCLERYQSLLSHVNHRKVEFCKICLRKYYWNWAYAWGNGNKVLLVPFFYALRRINNRQLVCNVNADRLHTSLCNYGISR